MTLDWPGLRWPLWSWRNLAITCLAILGLLFAIGQAMASTAPASPIQVDSPGTGSTAVPSADRSATSAVRNDAGVGPTPAAPRPTSSAPTAVTRFLTAWIRPSGLASPDALSAVVTPRLLGTLPGGGVAQLPVSRVYGSPVPGAHTPTSQAFAVSTDAGRLTVTAVLVPGGWLVDDVRVGDVAPAAPVPSIGPTRGAT